MDGSTFDLPSGPTTTPGFSISVPSSSNCSR
jgi:hypothetical protein